MFVLMLRDGSRGQEYWGPGLAVVTDLDRHAALCQETCSCTFLVAPIFGMVCGTLVVDMERATDTGISVVGGRMLHVPDFDWTGDTW